MSAAEQVEQRALDLEIAAERRKADERAAEEAQRRKR